MIPRRAPELKLDRLDEAFIFSRAIDLETYDRQRDRLREKLTLVQIDRHSTRLEELDVEGILAFAERLLPKASELWPHTSLDQRQRLHSCLLQRVWRSTKNASVESP
jgi:hypothetical protein